MSNYTIENLISASAGDGRIPAIKVGGQVFLMQVSGGGGGATDFYQCASVIPSVSFDAAGGLDPADGLYVCQNGRMLNGYPVYRKTGTSYYLSNVTNDGWIITDVDPEDDLTEHILFANNESADITDWPEPMTVTYAAGGTWTGYKAVFDSVTGIYGYEVTATTGLTYSLVTPVVGRVYADGALIEAKLWEGILLPDSPFAYGYPDPTWTSGQKLSSWGTFTQSDSTKQFEIATINGVTGLQNAAGMSMTAPSAITGNFSFCVKAYIAPDAALSGSCAILDTNSWGGALFALWANSDSGTYPMLSMRGYSYEAYSAPDMSGVSGVHTLVMTYNTDGTTKLYFDGVLSSSEYYEPGFDHGQTLYLLADTANVLTLGIAAYNRELTAAEAASIIW